MKVLNQSVKILAPDDGAEALRSIEYAGRNCYRSHDRMTDTSAGDFVRS